MHTLMHTQIAWEPEGNLCNLATKNKQKILTYRISAKADGKFEEGEKRDESARRVLSYKGGWL